MSNLEPNNIDSNALKQSACCAQNSTHLINESNFDVTGAKETKELTRERDQACCVSQLHTGADVAPLSCCTPNNGAFAADENAIYHCHQHAHTGHSRISCCAEGHEHIDRQGQLPWLILALVLALLAELMALFLPETTLFIAIGMGISVISISISGLSTYKDGLKGILKGKLNVNALMSVAVTGAFIIGEWPEAAMVMALFAIAEIIEDKSVDRARNAVTNLMKLAPEIAEVQNADGHWEARAINEIAIGEIVRVKPGERIPLDGEIISGNTTINQSPITGESHPVDKGVHDNVLAGTINETSAFTLKVTSLASNSMIARIIKIVEEAQNSRAPVQRTIDKFAAVYTPIVFLISLGVAITMPILFSWSWADAIYKALVILVISCPCAFVISTPVTIVSGLTNAAKNGVLIKGGIYLEKAKDICAVGLDKTGTITNGTPELVFMQSLSPENNTVDVHAIAFTIASHSSHPVSKAISLGLSKTQNEVNISQFTETPGKGVTAHINSEPYYLGNALYISELCNNTKKHDALITSHQANGETVTLLANKDKVLAIYTVSDTLKPHANLAISRLNMMGIPTIMLTGDNKKTASVISAKVGINDIRSELLPEQKLDAIDELKSKYGPVAMVGDGINDAPALAQSDVGIAMGGVGTDVAMEAADIVIMNDDISHIANIISLSKRTYRVLWQNITLALGIKTVFMLLAILGISSMWMAVFADVGASLLVIANGLRLLKNNAP